MTATGAEASHTGRSDLVADGPSFPVAAQDAATIRPGHMRPRIRLVRASIEGVLAVLALLAGWFLLRHGIRTDDFPPFIAGESSTPITRYSGPWLTAAAAMALVAGLLVLFAVKDMVRWSRTKSGSLG